jgi:uncharacterized membrane protein
VFLAMLVFGGLALWLIWVFAILGRAFLRGSSPVQRASAAHTLDQRLARGQIGASEYEYWRALMRDDEIRAARAGER